MAPSADYPDTEILTPIVEIEGLRFVVLLASITTVPARDLRLPVANLDGHAHQIKRGLNWLLFGA